MQLYMFYLGGNAGKSNIEVHDIQFVAARDPKEALACAAGSPGMAIKTKCTSTAMPALTGLMATVLRWPQKKPPATAPRLFFVNAGAYHPETLAELHAFDLFVATDAVQAKAKALASLLTGALQQHKDNLKEVDDCLLLEKIGDLYIHLTPDDSGTFHTRMAGLSAYWPLIGAH